MSGKLQLSVADPCHERWEKMTSTEQGRFCGSCQKTVTDFSMMSDKEIFNHLSQRDANVCGRFTNDQLNRPLRTEFKRKLSWAYIWNILIATFLTTASAEAQSKKATHREATVLKKDIREIGPEVQGNLVREIIFPGATSMCAMRATASGAFPVSSNGQRPNMYYGPRCLRPSICQREARAALWWIQAISP